MRLCSFATGSGGGYEVEQGTVGAVVHTQLRDHLCLEDLIISHACEEERPGHHTHTQQLRRESPSWWVTWLRSECDFIHAHPAESLL